MSDLAQALMVAIRVHSAHTDRQGEPYLLHVLRVVEAVSDEAKVVAALHDVLEDGPSAVAGSAIRVLSNQEVRALDLLTRRDDQTYGDYIAAIARERGEDRFGDIACEVKLADLRDNLGRIPHEPTEDGTLKRDSEWIVWNGAWGSLKRRYENAERALLGTWERVDR